MKTSPRQPNKTPSERIGRLACLPVFFTLQDKPALVAGGTRAATWKAELLAAAGARVHVCAPGPEQCEDMRKLAENGAISLHDRHWKDADWAGMTLAVGDCLEEEAPGFVERARAEGVPVNVIDKPAFCQFQFGSIVNRSPLVIGISTTAAAPILGQAVRRRIEALLPAALSAWAQLAQRMRDRVNATLAPGLQRRIFWERLVRSAFESAPTDHLVDTWLKPDGKRQTGRIAHLICPADSEDLRLRDIRTLQAADLIVHDREVAPAVLELARREAKRLTTTDFASESAGAPLSRMQHLAENGLNIVRLAAKHPATRGSRIGPEVSTACSPQGYGLTQSRFLHQNDVLAGDMAAPARNR